MNPTSGQIPLSPPAFTFASPSIYLGGAKVKVGGEPLLSSQSRARTSFFHSQILRKTQFLNLPRRLGALGHTTDDEGHRMLREALDDSERAREDARNLWLLEWAKELLLDESEA